MIVLCYCQAQTFIIDLTLDVSDSAGSIMVFRCGNLQQVNCEFLRTVQFCVFKQWGQLFNCQHVHLSVTTAAALVLLTGPVLRTRIMVPLGVCLLVITTMNNI